MYEKNIKIFIAFVLTVLLLFTFPATAFAYEYGSIDLNSMVQIRQYSDHEIRFLSGNNINRIRISKSAKYKYKSDKEKLKDIFTALDFTVSDQQFEKISENLKLSHIESIHVETSYIKTDGVGNQTKVSREEAMEAAAEEEARLNSAQLNISPASTESDTGPTTSHSSDVGTSEDGYMQMQIFAIYTPNYNGEGQSIGRYVFIGEYLWLKTPVMRKTDVISMHSDDINWYQKTTNGQSNYFLFAAYSKMTYDENGIFISNEDVIDSLDAISASVSSNSGVYFEYNLPNDNPLAQTLYRNFSFILFSVGRVIDYNNQYQFFMLDIRYVHIRNPLSASFSVNRGPLGVTVSNFFAPEYYDWSHSWDYANDW